jgi:stage II sporulation protein AA (anti-sigma F factor antagonist)
MEYQTRNTPEGVEVRISGRLEFSDHNRLCDIIAVLAETQAGDFIVELSGLEFIDSAGLGMLFILQEEADRKELRLVVRNPQGDVRRSIDLARISEIVCIEY